MTWVPTSLGEVCRSGGGGVQTGPFGSQLHASDYSVEGTPVVMPQDIGDNRIDTTNVARVDTAHVERLSRHMLALGDIVYSRRGDVERRALIREENVGWLCGTGCLRVHFGPRPAADPTFVSYYLGLPQTREWIVRHAVGATMLNLNTSILSAVPMTLPSLDEQRAIAEVLGALDDKIAANAKLALTAEDLLASLFSRSGLDAELASSASGPPIDDVVVLNPKLPAPVEDEPVYVDMQKLPTSGMSVAEWGHRPAKGGARFQNGDTLLARITPCLENGKTGYVDFLSDGQVGLGSTEYIVMRAAKGRSPGTAYFLAKSPRFREFAIRHMVGSSGRQRLSASDLRDYRLTQPDEEAMRRFEQTADTLMPRIGAARDESRTLARLRDVLLPQLMSGKIRATDAERMVEGAG